MCQNRRVKGHIYREIMRDTEREKGERYIGREGWRERGVGTKGGRQELGGSGGGRDGAAERERDTGSREIDRVSECV